MPEQKYRFTFGKHKGKVITDVPHHYLVWLYEQKPKEPLYSVLAVELSRRFALPDEDERRRVRDAVRKFCASL